MTDQARMTRIAVRVSLQDVADRAGVSAATASRSLRGLAKVSPETRQRVIDAARELSYTAALPAAPEFAPGPRKTVAIIVPFITRWFFTTVTAAAVDYLRENGYDVLLYHLGNADVRDDFFSRMPLAGRVDGILVLSAPLNEEHTLALRALTIPCVTVGTIVPGAPAVGFDAVAAARHAVNHLIHLRHRRIGLILGEADDPRFEFETSAQRRQGCEEALHSAGLSLPESLVATGPHGPDGGAQAMTELLSRNVLPTAVFAEYDELAIGALWAVRRAGLRVPGDISVISIDDHAMASMFDLTTVAQDVERQGSIAAELLLRAVGGQAFSPSEMQVLVPTRLMLRGTTAPPATPSDRRTGSRRRA
ncbi:MAG TPA: LacI family DNA-binding transcriptional regulator [Tetrasphaera sp.]|nr:LacI family DNA-binding transcriptional regulator [Tetrasphaera sp.]